MADQPILTEEQRNEVRRARKFLDAMKEMAKSVPVNSPRRKQFEKRVTSFEAGVKAMEKL